MTVKAKKLSDKEMDALERQVPDLAKSYNARLCSCIVSER